MPLDRPLRVLVVDDEPLARMRLRSLLAQSGVPVELVNELGEPVSALLWLQAQDAAGASPDVLLLDIQMPGLDGITLAARLRGLRQPPAVVFVTAHAEHAVRAFDLAAVDYLTKPVRLDRLQASLERASAWIAAREVAMAKAATSERDVLVLQDRGKVERLPLSDILYFKAEQKYVTLHTATDTRMLSQSLNELEEQVGDRFIRVHRNALVAKQAIRLLERRPDDEEGAEGWAVQVQPSMTWLSVSRRQVTAVREALAQQGPTNGR